MCVKMKKQCVVLTRAGTVAVSEEILTKNISPLTYEHMCDILILFSKSFFFSFMAAFIFF